MILDKAPGIWFIVCAVEYVIGLILCWIFASPNVVVGFLAGGALALGNIYLSGRRLRRADFHVKGAALASIMGGFYARLILLGILLYVMLALLHVNPVGLVLGLSIMPAGAPIMVFLIYIVNRNPEEA